MSQIVVTVLNERKDWVERHVGPFESMDEAQKFISDEGLRGRACVGVTQDPPEPLYRKAVFDFELSVGGWVVTVEQGHPERDRITSPQHFERAARNVCARVGEGARNADVS